MSKTPIHINTKCPHSTETILLPSLESKETTFVIHLDEADNLNYVWHYYYNSSKVELVSDTSNNSLRILKFKSLEPSTAINFECMRSSNRQVSKTLAITILKTSP